MRKNIKTKAKRTKRTTKSVTVSEQTLRQYRDILDALYNFSQENRDFITRRMGSIHPSDALIALGEL